MAPHPSHQTSCAPEGQRRWCQALLQAFLLPGGGGFFQVKVAQLCLTLCDPRDYTVHGILQARILEGVAVPFYRGSSQAQD